MPKSKQVKPAQEHAINQASPYLCLVVNGKNYSFLSSRLTECFKSSDIPPYKVLKELKTKQGEHLQEKLDFIYLLLGLLDCEDLFTKYHANNEEGSTEWLPDHVFSLKELEGILLRRTTRMSFKAPVREIIHL